MKTLLKLGLLLWCAVGYAHAQSCSDTFDYSGALNTGTWTTITASGYSGLSVSSGNLVPTTSGGEGVGICTGSGVIGPDQSATIVYGSASHATTGLAVRMDASGNGYFWAFGDEQIDIMTAGGRSAIIGGCPAPAYGDVLVFSIVGTIATCADTTAGLTHSGDTSGYSPIYSSGYPGFGVAGSDYLLPPFTSTGGSTAATPVFSPLGRVPVGQTLSISCSTASSTIYFTRDGTTPTTSSPVYSASYTVNPAGETDKALCTASGYSNSSIATQVYAVGNYTWFIRSDGGTRYDPTYATSGQCDGLADVSYASTGGTGTNQHCAYQEFQFLWDLGTSGTAHIGWVIVGGDTVVIRGCSAYGGQQNPSNPNCRIGWSANTGSANVWCYAVGNSGCYNPPIPAGSSSQHTKILGGCAYGTYTCTPIVMPYPFGTTNETQLYSGFGAGFLLDISGTSYVDIEGLEFTTHNAVAAGNAGYPSQCMTGLGENTWPQACANNQPLDDYGASGLQFSATSTDITLQDVYIHGFNASGIQGPIGAGITLTRVFSGFNAFAGWNFTSTYYPFDIPNGTNASIAASYVTMYANGFSEQYPIVNTQFPAEGGWDSNSGGFGDGWSGQDALMASFTCDHCASFYNTKDAFIGPHVQISNLSITNSTAMANMGSQWKWQDAVNATVLFQNNLTNNNCWRMTEQIPGARINFYIGTGLPGAYLDNFCRAGGAGFAVNSRAGAISNYIGNTTVGASNIFLQGDCGYYSVGNSFNRETTCGTAQNNMVNNVWLGYVDPNVGAPPALYCAILADGSDCSPTLPSTTGLTFTASYSSELGFKATDTCNVNGIICSDPLLKNEPAQTWPGSETAMDVYNPFVTGNSFYPTSGSPLIGAGTLTTGTDYYGVARSSPGTIGGVLFGGSSTGGTILSGHIIFSGSVTLQ